MRPVQKLLVILATTGMVLPGPVRGAERRSGPSPRATAVVPVPDVRLDSRGSFQARVLSPEGQPLGRLGCTLQASGQTLVTSPTAADGSLRFDGLSGGVYNLQIDQQVLHVRLWTAEAAPPGAVPELLIVHGSQLQRAQQPLCNLLGQEPIMIGLLIAAAIAIPIAVHNSGSDAPPSS
jgi:hypothetical protein